MSKPVIATFNLKNVSKYEQSSVAGQINDSMNNSLTRNKNGPLIDFSDQIIFVDDLIHDCTCYVPTENQKEQ